MDTINLVFNLVNNLKFLLQKYYLEIDGVVVFPEKHQSKYCFFKLIVHSGPPPIFRWRQVPGCTLTQIVQCIHVYYVET